MTFADIEKVIGVHLPEKASGIRAWWSNNPSNNVMTRAWLAAGYVTERVDMGSRRLVFRRSTGKPGALSRIDPGPSGAKAARSIGFLDRVRAGLHGTVTIPEGADILQPTGETWDADA